MNEPETAVCQEKYEIEIVARLANESKRCSCNRDGHRIIEYAPRFELEDEPDTPESIVEELKSPKKSKVDLHKGLKDPSKMTVEEMGKELGIPPEELK